MEVTKTQESPSEKPKDSSVEGKSLREFLTIDEVSECLGIKKSSLYGKVERKQIPFYKIGHLLRFKKSDIDSWAEKLKSEPVDLKKETKKRVPGSSRAMAEIKSMVGKAIAEVKGMPYNPNQGKPDRTFRGLGKEVKNGSL
ncbi:MAG: helix-turn-helix domain-containing protein [Deltaproteobacteria bacterium]